MKEFFFEKKKGKETRQIAHKIKIRIPESPRISKKAEQKNKKRETRSRF